jgi:DNA polymerase-1
LDKVRELFTSLEFKTLLERLLADLPEAAEGEGTPFELEVRVADTSGALAEVAAAIRAAGSFALDITPAMNPRHVPRALSLAWGDNETAYVPLRGADVSPLAPLLEDAAIEKVVHSGRIATLSLGAAGIDLRGVRLDTHVAAYLLDPGATGYALEEVSRKYIGRELKAVGSEERDASAAQGSLDLGGPEQDEIDAEAASLRALAVRELAEALEPELERLGMRELYRDVEHPLVEVLARMEEIGVRVDLDYLGDIGATLDKRISELETECYELAGERINLGSPPQLRVLLYDKLGLKTTRRTKTGLSTDARALQQLVGQHPFVEKLLDYREVSKLKNTYIDALPPLVEDDGRIHTTYDQTVAATGRLSSTNPNLMNIPIRTDLGKQIRRAFIPEDGNLLLSADYSQIELRVMAHLSEDPILLEVFERGEDVHAATACRIFRVQPEEITTYQRSAAKMVNYGLSYGMGAPGLAERLNVARDEAEEIMDAYYEQFEGVAGFLDRIVKQAHADGFTTTMFGRRRYLPELGSGNPRVRAIGERQALNAPIQGTAADIMKLAMIRVDERLATDDVDTRMILTVHDELVFEVPLDEKDRATIIVEESMTGVCDMRVPLAVDVSFGANWAEAKG